MEALRLAGIKAELRVGGWASADARRRTRGGAHGATDAGVYYVLVRSTTILVPQPIILGKRTKPQRTGGGHEPPRHVAQVRNTSYASMRYLLYFVTRGSVPLRCTLGSAVSSEKRLSNGSI